MNTFTEPQPTKNITMTTVNRLATATRKSYQAKRQMKASTRRSAQQYMAAIAAAFLPVASYVIAHIEAPTVSGWRQWALYGLVVAALTYSAPTLAKWAKSWTGHIVKAWGFTILLEGVMVLSHMQPLNLSGLAILVLINAITAWDLAGRRD